MGKFWHSVNQVIEQSDIILIVLDSRMPELTRNSEIESKIKAKNKPFIFVLNKVDLIDKEEAEIIKKKLRKIAPCVFVSSIEHLGVNLLKQEIMKMVKKIPTFVGVVGYPNTGKSSVINIYSKRKAKTSSFSGYTKGKQILKSSAKLKFIDSPGVLPFEDKDELKLSLIGSKNPEKIKDPERVAIHIINMNPEKIKEHYDVQGESNEEILSNIAIIKKKMLKGNHPDINTMSIILIKDFQTGKIVV